MKKYQLVFLSLFIFIAIGLLGGSIILSEKPTGSMSGIVLDSKGGKPIKNAKIGANGSSYFSVKSKDDGTFILPKLTVGNYTIAASAHGYDTKWSNKTIEIKEGIEVKGLTFKLYEKEPELYVDTYNKVYSPDEKITMKIRSALVPNAELKLYKVDPADWIQQAGKLTDKAVLVKQWQMPLVGQDKYKNDNEQSDYDENRVELPITDKGAYIIKIEGYSIKKTILNAQWWFVKSDLSLVTKQESGRLLCYATSFQNKQPLKDVNINIYKKEDSSSNSNENKRTPAFTPISGTTNNDGIYTTNLPDNTDTYRIAAYQNNSIAFTYSSVYSSSQRYKIYSYTDRPVYRPDQKVYFKGTVRKSIKGQNILEAFSSAIVRVDNPNGDKIYEKNLRLNAYGSYSDSLVLDKEASLGEYTITTTINGDSGYSYFKILEYRKPEFKIDIKTDKNIYIGGEDVQATVMTNYYFGSPVAKANVNYTVYEANDWSYDTSEDDFYSGYDDSGEYSYPGDYGEILTQGEGVTNEKGELKLNIKSKKIEPAEGADVLLYNKRYTIEVEATELSRKPVKNTYEFKVVKGEYEIYLKTNKYIYQPDTPVMIDINTVRWDNKKSSNTPLQLIVNKEEYKDNQYTLTPVQTLNITTDTEGKVTASVPGLKEGYYIIKAVGQDSFNNRIISQGYIWVSGEDYWSGNYEDRNVDLVLDKKTYKPDDTAKILINSPAKDVYALVSIEGEKIHEYQVIHIKGHSRLIEVPLKKDYMPAVYISVCFTSDKEFFNRQKMIKISPEEKFINIKMETEKKKYEPGESITYNITAKDNKDKPVRTELSLGVVDASIYAIEPDSTPDIRRFFYTPSSNRVETNYSFAYDYSGGVEKEDDIKVRKNFQDTAFWDPYIYTDAQGKAAVTFKLPDNLTTWIATVRSINRDTMVGQAFNDVLATKPLLVRLSTPRFFTQGDKMVLSGIVHNYTDKKQNIKLKIKGENIKLLDTAEMNVSVDKDSSYRYDWKFHANESGNTKITVYAMGETASDAMELEIPSNPHGIKRFLSLSGSLKGDENEKDVAFNIPETILKNTLALQLNLTPTPAAAMLGALPYMQDYPYSCVEQTMSMITTNIVSLNTIQRFGIYKPELKAKATQALDTGLRRIYSYQHSDGGWGWWNNDDSQVFLTSYVLYGFHLLEQSHIDITDSSITRGCEFLEKAIKDIDKDVNSRYVVDFGAGYDTRAYALYSISWHKKPDSVEMGKLFNEKDKLSNYSKALFAIALNNAGNKEMAQQLLADLDSQKMSSDIGTHWESKSAKYSWLDNDTEATAYALKAYLEIDPQNTVINDIVSWLIKERQGDHWLNTKDTAAAIFSINDYLQKGDLKVMPSYIASASYKDNLLGEFDINRRTILEEDRVVKLKGDQVTLGDNTIKLAKKGEGNLYYSLGINYFDKQEDIPAAGKDLTVKRDYFILTPHQAAQSGSDENSGFAGYFSDDVTKTLKPLEEKVKSGNKILVRLTLTARDNYHYLMIEDPLPSGCEALEEDQSAKWNYWWANHEIRDEKMVFFVTDMKKGMHKLYYIMQPEIPGDYHVLPTLASCMYIPEIRGNGAESRMIIEE